MRAHLMRFLLYHFANLYVMPHSAGVSHTPKMDTMSWLALSPSGTEWSPAARSIPSNPDKLSA